MGDNFFFLCSDREDGLRIYLWTIHKSILLASTRYNAQQIKSIVGKQVLHNQTK